ncbi:MAG: (2Fe-2S)-binding protein [Hydrogenophaga sp.]|uniref:(2Fe-2S)-binding protein n=1 Tax=Hydrogenophaga sp. TaxID=1904254 RepID=UPI0025BBA7E9|nr:2Fe-2S iron-sulfur cluster-binding protein [Hydrogenophaga sp.]MBU7573503.1 (2Fe-2S)-binding protein [Hydrogenophaga sp.]
MTEAIRIQLRVNGQAVERDVEPRLTLADFLRDELDLTGTHLGCEHGVCGACTVLLDQEPVRACLMFAVQADGRDVGTVEGLSRPGELTDLQASFRRHHALQCGFCTPGMLTTAHAFLERTPCPTREEACEAISGNICRCTGYIPIVDAIVATAEARQAQKAGGRP